ncbi:MAG: hypothetical protein AAF492_13660 [Verrucomicrobiota bacterium]
MEKSMKTPEMPVWDVKTMNFFLVPLFPCFDCNESTADGINWFIKANHHTLGDDDVVTLFTMN